MSSKWVWLVSVVARRIWFRATLFSIAAIATALVSIVASPYFPASLSTNIGADSVENKVRNHLLQAETDTDANSAGEHRQSGKIDTGRGQSQNSRNDDQGDLDQFASEP